ncbi:glycoside hydrolase family 65 protein [Actinoplanes sp. URMC 104]|uniref:glycoside hydrolase family 65 protein n=1 Tax=Actinoplanes sp. URMC 104 TaxID=3423409 RepID=UPI003F1E44D8
MRDQLSDAEWLIRESGFDPLRANTFETLLTVGNGHLGTRGTLEEGWVGERSGTFLSGVYDSHDATVIDLVNAPDWLPLVVFVDGVRLDVETCETVEHERALDIRQGVLWRRTIFRDRRGRRTRIESLRFASLADRRLCAVRLEVTPEDHSSTITVESGIAGRRRNLDRLPFYPEGTVFDPEVQWEKWAWSNHLRPVTVDAADDMLYLETRTIAGGVSLGYAASLDAGPEPLRRRLRLSAEHAEEQADFVVAAGETLRLDKLVTIVTSRNHPEPVQRRCLETLQGHRRTGLDAALSANRQVWESMWNDCDCQVVGDPVATQAVRFGVYQLLIAANGEDPTVNIGAKSLTGEGYRGHVFWDTEILMLPFFIYTQPDTARSLLRYRHHTLPGAREVARESGFRGARFPWESADSGREECPRYTTDGANRFWTRDEEVHVSADVAYGILTYVAATGDHDFLVDFGAEVLFETSRFWVSRVEHDPATDRYALKQVMGPDEFHSHVDNNAFTNRFAQWHLDQSVQLYEDLSAHHPQALRSIEAAIGLDGAEVRHWREVAERIILPIDPERELVEQFEGYFERKDVPITQWDANNMPRYPAGYHHFNCEDTMLLKQPDVVMLMYLLPDDFTAEVKRANFEFYEARTLHKSSLSPAIHAIMGIEVGDHDRALEYFYRSALVDLADNQGNTAYGIHIASAGGTWQTLVNGFGGLRLRHGRLTFDPWLPEQWEEIRFRLRWRGNSLSAAIRQRDATFCLHGPAAATEEVVVAGAPLTLTANEPATVSTAKGART